MASTPQPSAEHMLRAWQELAQPNWGALADASVAAARYSLVRARAAALASGRVPAVAAPNPSPAPSLMGSLKVPTHPPIFDRKRAAAGEREGD